MLYFRIVRSERRGDGIWLLLSPNGLETPNAPVAMMDDAKSLKCTVIWTNITLGIYWVHESDVVHEGMPQPTTCEEWIESGCPI